LGKSGFTFGCSGSGVTGAGGRGSIVFGGYSGVAGSGFMLGWMGCGFVSTGF